MTAFQHYLEGSMLDPAFMMRASKPQNCHYPGVELLRLRMGLPHNRQILTLQRGTPAIRSVRSDPYKELYVVFKA